MSKFGLLLISFLYLTACNQQLRSQAEQTDLNSVPNAFEDELDEDSNTTSANRTRTNVKADRLIYFAQKIIDTEAQKIGTACNHYLHRVLAVSGFPDDDYLANDFHLYAKKNFKYYIEENFEHDPQNLDVARLDRYLKSYPERTAFIFQWRRSGGSGHVAFVERIGEKFKIYQASLNKYTARSRQTTPRSLLNDYGRNSLTVYAKMK